MLNKNFFEKYRHFQITGLHQQEKSQNILYELFLYLICDPNAN